MVKCLFNFQNTYLQQVPKFMKRYYEIDLKHFVTSSSVKPSPENLLLSCNPPKSNLYMSNKIPLIRQLQVTY